jgi:hypothetical protein
LSGFTEEVVFAFQAIFDSGIRNCGLDALALRAAEAVAG